MTDHSGRGHKNVDLNFFTFFSVHAYISHLVLNISSVCVLFVFCLYNFCIGFEEGVENTDNFGNEFV